MDYEELWQYKQTIAFDVGDKDLGIAENLKELDEILTGYGIAHEYEVYDGNHVNRIQERIEKHVIPFFSRYLAFSSP